MRIRLTIALLASALALAMATPAVAEEPTTQEFTFSGVIQAFVPECDAELRWEISGEGTRTTFFDDDGAVVRLHDRIRETNTITNLTTGESYREGPDSFLQRILFEDDGTITIEINGLSVIVTSGEDLVINAGRLVLGFGPTGPEVVAVAGQQDLRLISPFSTSDPALLAGFCDAFD